MSDQLLLQLRLIRIFVYTEHEYSFIKHNIKTYFTSKVGFYCLKSVVSAHSKEEVSYAPDLP